MGGRLVILDDNRRDLERMKFILSDKGYSVQGMGNPRDAVDILHRESADAMICEINLPGMDGFEVLADLKSDEITSRVPVLFVSGDVIIPERYLMEFNGKVGFLQKPVTGDELVEKLQALQGGE